MPTTVGLDTLYKPIAGALESVRETVADLCLETLRLVHGDLLPRPPIGGKMLRPALCLLSAGATGAEDLAFFAPMAAAMELLHIAALAHDDVLDGATMRRGEQSLNSRWDNHAAVLGGDYLVARAIQTLGTYDNCRVITNAVNSVQEMAEGELRHFANGRIHGSQESCIALARKKTASLFAVTCSTPSCLTEGRPHAALYDYGMALGVAFQLVDDLLDLVQDEHALGKPACLDIVEGKGTLPILLMRKALDSAGKRRLDAMKGATLMDEDRDWIAEMLEQSGAPERTEAVAREYSDQARAALLELPAGVYRDSMMGLAEFVLVRGS